MYKDRIRQVFEEKTAKAQGTDYIVFNEAIGFSGNITERIPDDEQVMDQRCPVQTFPGRQFRIFQGLSGESFLVYANIRFPRVAFDTRPVDRSSQR